VATTGTGKERIQKAITENVRREIEAALTYRALADGEKDARKRGILAKMADMEDAHARRWVEELQRLGADAPPEEANVRERIQREIKGQRAEDVVRRMEAAEEAHAEEYRQQVEALGAERYGKILEEISKDEKGHAKTLADIASDFPISPVSAIQERLDQMRNREKWHVSTGSWLGDAIYGVNDGLGAIFGIVSGVAGYTGGSHFVVIAGLAGMLASTLSMASGAYLSVKSEAEIREAEIHREGLEIAESPEEERAELSLLYQLKGLSEEEADAIASRLSENESTFLKTMAQEELGISEDTVKNPVTSAVSGGISTAVGAMIPVVPFFFLTGLPAVIVAAGVSLAAHFGVGAAKSLVTVRSWWKSGFEMMIVGAIEGGITYFIGVALSAHP